MIEGSGLTRNSIRLNFDLKVSDRIRTGVRLELLTENKRITK